MAMCVCGGGGGVEGGMEEGDCQVAVCSGVCVCGGGGGWLSGRGM